MSVPVKERWFWLPTLKWAPPPYLTPKIPFNPTFFKRSISLPCIGMCAQYISSFSQNSNPKPKCLSIGSERRRRKKCRNLTSVCLRFNEIHYVLDNRASKQQRAVIEFGPINWPPVIRTESKTYAWHTYSVTRWDRHFSTIINDAALLSSSSLLLDSTELSCFACCFCERET